MKLHESARLKNFVQALFSQLKQVLRERVEQKRYEHIWYALAVPIPGLLEQQKSKTHPTVEVYSWSIVESTEFRNDSSKTKEIDEDGLKAWCVTSVNKAFPVASKIWQYAHT